MNFENSKKKRNLLTTTANVMRKRWWIKAIKSKQQYSVWDIFTNKTDSQDNKLQQNLRKNDREFHYKWVVTPFITASVCIFSGSISESNIPQGLYNSFLEKGLS